MKSEREEGMMEFQNKCQIECSFLYNKYTDIFNRLINDVGKRDIHPRERGIKTSEKGKLRLGIKTRKNEKEKNRNMAQIRKIREKKEGILHERNIYFE
jgi:hypothetical protein